MPGLLPPGSYHFANAPDDAHLATLAFALGSYRFSRYRKADAVEVKLVPPEGLDGAEIGRTAEAAYLARDLINTPSNDMGPEELAQAAHDLARRHSASFNCIAGDELRQGFPLIHAVGMASPRAPRLIDISWGNPAHPKVTLVGKGVCFDTGGLDLKTSGSMLIMKKDMGGAANVLALAAMVMIHFSLPSRDRSGEPEKIDIIGGLLLAIGMIGGVAQFALFGGCRHAPASVMATVEYTALIWAFMLGYVIWGTLLRTYPSAKIGPVSLLVPCCALVFSALLTGEPVGGLRLAGVIVVLGGVALGMFARSIEHPAVDKRAK